MKVTCIKQYEGNLLKIGKEYTILYYYYSENKKLYLAVEYAKNNFSVFPDTIFRVIPNFKTILRERY